MFIVRIIQNINTLYGQNAEKVQVKTEYPLEELKHEYSRYVFEEYNHLRLRSIESVCCLMVLCMSCSSTLEVEVVSVSKTPLKFYRTTRRYIQEYIHLLSHRCENLMSTNTISDY
jgi:hypothetical protein